MRGMLEKILDHFLSFDLFYLTFSCSALFIVAIFTMTRQVALHTILLVRQRFFINSSIAIAAKFPVRKTSCGKPHSHVKLEESHVIDRWFT